MRYIRSSVLFFLLFFVIYLIIGYKEKIDNYSLFTQITYGIISYLYILCNKNNISIRKIFLFTFIFQLSLTLILRMEYILFENYSILGNDPNNDGIAYFHYVKIGVDKTITQYRNIISDNNWDNINDYGYTFYLYFLHKFMSYEVLLWVVIILNSFYISIASVYLYKTCNLLGKNNDVNHTSSLITAIFSSFLFFVNSSSVGRKEDLFILPITLMFYFLIKYQLDKKTFSLIMFLFWCLLTIFFRGAVTFIFIISFIIGIIPTYKNRKIYTIILLIISFFGPLMLNLVAEKIFGMSMDSISSIAESRYSSAGENSNIKKIGDILASFVGPFPNYTYFKDSLHYGFSSVLKMILNLPVLLYILKVIKNMDIKLYTLCFSYLFGIILLAITGTGLDMRYHIPFFIPFMLILYKSLNCLNIKKTFLFLYYMVCILLIYNYNLR